MTTSVQPVSKRGLPGKFHDAAEWLRELGDVPPERIIMDPWPGTATEDDLLYHIERDMLCELIDGTLVKKPVRFVEALIASRLVMVLGTFVHEHWLGVVAGGDGPLRMASKRVRLPDVTFVSVADLPGGIVPLDSIADLPPTLAVEVISKSNTASEMRQKIIEYFESGSRLVWLIYPESRTVAVFEGPSEAPSFVLQESGSLTGQGVLPGFEMNVADLFVTLPQK